MLKELTLYQTTKLLALTKLKEFTDEKFNVAKIIFYVFDGIENMVEKEKKKCWLPAFSTFSTMVLKAFIIWVVKSLDCVVRG